MKLSQLVLILLSRVTAANEWQVFDGINPGYTTATSAVFAATASQQGASLVFTIDLSTHSQANPGTNLFCSDPTACLFQSIENTASVPNSNITYSSAPWHSVTVTLNKILAAGNYTFDFKIYENSQNLDMRVTLTVVTSQLTLSWTSYSSGKEQTYASSPTTALTTFYQYLQTTSYSKTIDLAKNSLTQDGHNLQYPSADTITASVSSTITASVSSTLKASVTFSAGNLLLSITDLTPGCQGTYTMQVTFTDTNTMETQLMTITLDIIDTCYASDGTTIFMPTFSNVAYTVGTGVASNPSVTIDLSSVASVGTTGCLGIVTTCSAPAAVASSTSYQVSYDATITTAVTKVVNCTATQEHYNLSISTTFNVVYTVCPALTFSSSLPVKTENLYKSSTLTWSWLEIESLVSNYQPICQMQLISVTSTIPNAALYSVSGTFPLSSDLTITINLLNQPLSALAAGSYPFTLNMKYLPSAATTAVSAPVTLNDPCLTTTYAFPPSLEILYGSNNLDQLQFPLLDNYSQSVGKDVCGPTKVELRLQYTDALGNVVLKTLSSTSYPQFSANKFSIAENKTFGVDTNFEVWFWIGGKGAIKRFTLIVVVCDLRPTSLVLSYQIQDPQISDAKTYSIQELGYSFSYNNHPLCLNPVLTFIDCTSADSRYLNADPTRFSSSFDQTGLALTINVASPSTQGKYKLTYYVTMQCGTVSAIEIEIWVMIQATACTLADGNFIPSTGYRDNNYVRVGSSAIQLFPTVIQKSASSSCSLPTQQLCQSTVSPCVEFTSSIFSIANRNITVQEDSTICNNVNDKVCKIQIIIRTYLADQESIAPVEVYDTFIINFVNCKYAQISYIEPLLATGLPQPPLLIHPVSGSPWPYGDPQAFTFKVSDDVSDQIYQPMYCATYNMTITAIHKQGDQTFAVPVTQLDYTVIDKLNSYQTVSFGISDAFWKFYDLLNTDYYTFEFTWFASLKNRLYGGITDINYAPINISATFDFSVSRCIVDNYTVSTTSNQIFTLYVVDKLEIQLLLGKQNPNCQHPVQRYDVSSLGLIPSAYYNVNYTTGVVQLTIIDSEANQPIIKTFQPITYRPIFQFMPDLAADTTFTVYVENQCKTISLSAAQQISNVVYNITQPAIVIQIPTVRDSVSILMKTRNYCGPTHYRILYQDDVSTYPFIWIQETTIYISTASQNYIGTYDFVIQAYIQTFDFNTVNLPFTLQIQQAKVESTFSVLTPPSFSQKFQSSYTTQWNATLIIQLTVLAQPEFTFKIDWQSLSLISHSDTLVDSELQIMIGPSGESNSTISGQFLMELIDTNGKTSYTVEVKILGAKAYEEYLQTQLGKGNLTSAASKPGGQLNISGQVYTSGQYQVRESKARISSVSRDGLITVSFQPMIDALDNALSFIQQDKLLLVEYIQNNEVNQDFNWTLVAFSRTRLLVQCFFTKPLAVSQGDSPDEIKVSMSKSILLNHQPHRLLQVDPLEYQTISAFIPLQARTTEEAVKLEQYSNFVSTAAQTIFWLFIVLQFFARTIIKNLWDVFNYLQILLQLPLFRLKLTVTVLAYCVAVDSIINLKFLPKDTIESWFPSSPDTSRATGSYPAKIIMFVIALSILFVLLVFIIKIRQNSFDLLPKPMQRIFRSLEDKIMFSAVLRTMIQSYLATSIATVLQLTDFTNRVAWFGAVLILGYLIGFPYFTFKFQRIFRWKLREPKTRQQFGTMYKDIDVYNLPAACWTMIFLYRRLLFAVIILVDIPVIQVALLSILQIFTLVYLFRVWPMVDTYSNLIAILNEVSIYVLAVLSLAFTDYVSDVDLRMAYGFWFLYIVAATIGLNVLILTVQYCVNRKRLNALRKSQKQQIMPSPKKVQKQHKKANSKQQLLQDKSKTNQKEVIAKTISESSQEAVQQQQPKTFSFNDQASKKSISKSIHIDESYHPQMSSIHIEESHHPVMSIHIDESYHAKEASNLSDLISHRKQSIYSDHEWGQATSAIPALKLLRDNSLDHRLNDIEAQLRSPPSNYQKPMQRSPQQLRMPTFEDYPAQQSRPIQDIARPVQRKAAPVVPLQAARQERSNPQPTKKAALNDPHQLVSFNQPKITQSTYPNSKPSKYGNVLIQFK